MMTASEAETAVGVQPYKTPAPMTAPMHWKKDFDDDMMSL